jgi:hypothetical protein
MSAACLTDMSPQSGLPLPPGTTVAAFARDGVTWARADALGGVSVRDRLDRELAALPSPGRQAERLTFSPDGLRLAAVHAAGGPPILLVWDWGRREIVARLEPAPPDIAWEPGGHALYAGMAGGHVGRLALDADAFATPVPGARGQILAAGPGGALLLRDVRDLRRLHVASARTGEVIGRIEASGDAWVGVLDPVDGRRALVSSGAELMTFDVATGRRLATMRGHDAAIVAACFSDDGRFAASHGWDGVTRAWDAGSGRALGDCLNAPRGLPELAFAPGGAELLAHCDGVRTGPFELALDVPSWEIDLRAMLGFAPGLGEISDDGARLLAWAEPGRIGPAPALVDLDARGLLEALPDEATSAAAFLPDGAGLVTSGERGVRAWTLGPAGAVPRTLLAEPTAELAIAPDAGAIAVVLRRTREVATLRLSDGATLGRMLPPRAPFTLALDGRAERVAAGSWHGSVAACYPIGGGATLFEVRTPVSAGVQSSPVDGSLVLHSGDEVRLLDPATGAVRAALPLGGGFDVPVRLAIARDAALAVVPDPRRRGALRLLDARTLGEIASLDVPEPRSDGVAWCAIDAAGARLCAGTLTGRLVTWELAPLRAMLRERGLDW